MCPKGHVRTTCCGELHRCQQRFRHAVISRRVRPEADASSRKRSVTRSDAVISLRQPVGLRPFLLLPRHRDADRILRLDEVIHALGVLSDCQLHALNLTIESVAGCPVVLGDWSPAVFTDIQAIIG